MTKLKIHLAQINNSTGDLEGNCQKILQEFILAKEANCDLVVFCEMALSGYPCEDLWQKKSFISEVEKQVQKICDATRHANCAVLLGAPTIDLKGKKPVIRNSALFIENGEIKKIINKKTLPNYGVFDEKRYFEPENMLSTLEFRDTTLAILICEDLWSATNIYLLGEQVFDIGISINASPYSEEKMSSRRQAAERFSTNLKRPLIYVNQVGGQDSLVFDGASFVSNSAGKVVLQMKEFAEDNAQFEITKDGQITAEYQNNQLSTKLSRHYQACVLGLRDYLQKNNFDKVLLGMSGGIDSALVATMAVDAVGSKNVSLYALPSRYNSKQSMDDAVLCAKNLNLDLQVISIESTFETMLLELKKSQENLKELTEQNLQSRIRGNILMAISNNTGALLLTTGNKSEMAMGYATLYGDMCGAFNPIKDIYKTNIYELVKWRNENIFEISCYKKTNLIPQSIINKEPTAELKFNQKDSDSLPEYDVLDKILYQLIEEEKSIEEIVKTGFSEELVNRVAKGFYASEYKRRQAALGVKISERSFDKERRYPISNKFVK